MSKKIVKAEAKVTQQPISYKGEVTLKIQKDGYTLKTIKANNSGTLLLFSGIARFLAGQFINNPLLPQENYIPSYLGLGYQDLQTPTDPLSYKLYNEYPINRIPLDIDNIKIDGNARTVMLPFKATIFYSEIGSRRISELGLFSSPTGNEHMLARVNIPKQGDGDPGITLSVGMNLLVEWNIVIQNIM